MERRRNTIPKKIRLTEEAYAAIEQWSVENDVSFSAAIETLARLGLGQPASEALAPTIVSSVRREIGKGYDRLARLLLFNIVESGIGSRAALSSMSVLFKDDPAKYARLKQAVQTDARRNVARSNISRVIKDLQDGDTEE